MNIYKRVRKKIVEALPEYKELKDKVTELEGKLGKKQEEINRVNSYWKYRMSILRGKSSRKVAA